MVHWHWNIVKEQIISDFSISFFQEEKPTSRIPKPELDLLRKKKKKNKRSPQQTVLVVCPRSLDHSWSGIIGGGLWKAQKQFWGDPGCAFQKNLMSSGAWKTDGRGKQNLGGKRMGIPSAHHGAPSSGACSEKLFSLSDGLGKVPPTAYAEQAGKTAHCELCCPCQTECDAWYVISTILAAFSCCRAVNWVSPRTSFRYFSISSQYTLGLRSGTNLLTLWIGHAETLSPCQAGAATHAHWCL